MSLRWHIVADRDADPEGNVWTLSTDPTHPGWDTDGGYPGYGLPKAVAEFLAAAANAAVDRGQASPEWHQELKVSK